MKKSTKIVLKSVALGTALTAAGVTTTTVAHADDGANQATTQQQDQTKQQLTKLKDQQTQAENTLADQNKAEMETANQTANAKLDQLNNQLKDQKANQAAQDKDALAAGTDKINKAADQATTKENDAYSAALAKQQAANKKALDEAQSKVVTPEQQAQQKDQAKTDYQNNLKQLGEKHQTNLDQLKQKHDQAVNNINKQISDVKEAAKQSHDEQIKKATADVDGQIKDATTALNNAQQLLKAAQQKLANDQKKADKNDVELNAAGFFKSIINSPTASDAEKEDAQLAYNIVTGTGSVPNYDGSAISAPSWYSKAVHIGKAGDATTLDAMKQSLILYKDFTAMRQKRGLSVPKVSLVATAIAMVDADYQTTLNNDNALAHPKYYPNSENLAVHSVDGAVDYWMSEENLWDKYVQKYPELVNHLYDGYWVFVNYPEVYQATGHFLNFIAKDIDAYGFAVADVPAGNLYHGGGNQFEAFDTTLLSLDDGLYSVDEYSKLLNDFITTNDPSLTIKDDQQDVTQKQTAVNDAQKKLDDLNQTRDEIINKINDPATEENQIKDLEGQISTLGDSYAADVKQENNDYATKSAALKQAYDQKIKDIEAEPTSTAQLEQQLNAKLDQLKKAHEAKLAQIKQDAQNQITALEKQLSASHDAENQLIIDQINQIKQDLAAKQSALDTKLANLKAQDAAEYAQLAKQLAPKESANVVKGQGNSYVTSNGVRVSLPANHQVAANVNAASVVRPANQVSAKALPQTGSKDSAAVIALAALTGMLGLSLATKKREF